MAYCLVKFGTGVGMIVNSVSKFADKINPLSLICIVYLFINTLKMHNKNVFKPYQ